VYGTDTISAVAYHGKMAHVSCRH